MTFGDRTRGGNNATAPSWTQLFTIFGTPIAWIIILIIFQTTGVPIESVGASIGMNVLGGLLFLYSIYSFYIIGRLLFIKTTWTERQEGDQHFTTITLWNLIEFVVVTYYALVTLAYASFLLDNNGWVYTLQDLSGCPVGFATTNHFVIFWIFVFYIPLVSFGVGLTFYGPIKIWPEIITWIAVVYKQTIFIILVSSIIGVILERRDRLRDITEEKHSKPSGKENLLQTSTTRQSFVARRPGGTMADMPNIFQ